MKAIGLAVALVAAAAAPAQAKVQNLYHPGKETFYAFVDRAVAAHSQPKASARTVGRLKTRTPDATDELVLVLARTTDELDRTWYRVRLPIRPNGTTGWVPADALSELQPLDTWLKIKHERVHGDADQGRQEDLLGAGRRRPAAVGDAEGPVLRPRRS